MNAKSDPEVLYQLEKTLNSVTEGMPKVSCKKMFGCHALWANGNVFAMVWKAGRIGLKLTNEADFTKLLNLSDATPWKAGSMTMSHWVLVPTSFHSNGSNLKQWATKAHKLALNAEPKKTAPKKNAKKKSKQSAVSRK